MERAGPDDAMMRLFLPAAGIALVAGVVPVSAAPGGELTFRQELVPDELTGDTRFPYSIDIDGNTAVTGAKWHDVEGAPDAGATFVYERARDGTWQPSAVLTAPEPLAGAEFGLSVEIEGDTIIIGAPFCSNDLRDVDTGAREEHVCPPGPGRESTRDPSVNEQDDLDSGKAYVFERDATGAWHHAATLVPDDAQGSDAFGWSLGFDGDVAVISAPWADPGGRDDAGAAYAFVRDRHGTWSQEATLVPAESAVGDNLGYGYGTSVSGRTAIVGAFHADGAAGPNVGAAYAYRRSGRGTWTQEATLTAVDAAPASDLGHSVALDGTTVLIGSPGRIEGGRPAQGAAHLFKRRGGRWEQDQKLVSPDALQGPAPPLGPPVFGASVALDEGTAVVLSPNRSSGELPSAGAAYVYTRRGGGRGYRHETTLRHPDSRPGDILHEAAIDRRTIMVGAAGRADERGSLLVFTR